MAIVDADVKFFLSGGAGNSDPNASLGGVMSSTEVVDNTLHNLFDYVSGTEAGAGDTEYRAIYLKNTNSVNAGSFTVGNEYTILSVGTTDFTAIGAASNTVGVTFTATGVGSGTGTAGQTMFNTVVYIDTDTPSTDSDIQIGIDDAGVGDGSSTGVADSVANESTAPSTGTPGVSTWETNTGLANSLSAGTIKAGQAIAIWFKRVISAGAAAYSLDNLVYAYNCDSES